MPFFKRIGLNRAANDSKIKCKHHLTCKKIDQENHIWLEDHNSKKNDKKDLFLKNFNFLISKKYGLKAFRFSRTTYESSLFGKVNSVTESRFIFFSLMFWKLKSTFETRTQSRFSQQANFCRSTTDFVFVFTEKIRAISVIRRGSIKVCHTCLSKIRFSYYPTGKKFLLLSKGLATQGWFIRMLNFHVEPMLQSKLVRLW